MYKRIMLSLSFFKFLIEHTEDNLKNFIQILHVYVTGHRLLLSFSVSRQYLKSGLMDSIQI